jgi:hypothetical protein
MNFRLISLALISAVLVAEGYLVVDKYFIPKVPLQFVDWSRRVLTLEEQHQLYEELRVNLMGVTDPSSGIMLSGLIRSISEPKRICGLAKHKDRKGQWLDWNQFAVTFSRYGMGAMMGGGINREEDYKGTKYLREGIYRPLKQDDSVECEPVSPCEMCFGPPPKISESGPKD